MSTVFKNDKTLLKGKISSLKYLGKYLAAYKIHLIGVLLAIGFTSLAVLMLGSGIKYVIDQGFGQQNAAMLDHGLIILLGVIVMLAIASYSRSSLINIIAERVVASIRQDVYSHVIKLSPGFFEVNKTSDIISRLTVDTTILSSIIGNATSFALRNLIMMFGGLIFLLVTSPKLTLYVLLTIPVIILPILFIGRRVRKLSKIVQEEMVDVTAHIEESINAIKTIQALTGEESNRKQFFNLIATVLDGSITRIRVRALMVAIVILFVFSAVTFVLWIGGHDMLAGKNSAGDLSSFIFYSVLVVTSIGGLSEAMGDLQRVAGATERLFGLFEVSSDIMSPILSSETSERSDIVFKDVNFAYPARPDHLVCKNFNLTITQGEKIALVGPSGSGKTTIFQLLLRFYDPKNGNISLGAVDIKNLKLTDLRKKFALVPQEPVIFSATAYENILLGKKDATEKEVREAAMQAQILDFLESLPEGLNSFLGEKGVRISGGQKQRIAIARAMLQNPEILLLDEATSNLDAENVKLVKIAMDNLMTNRTTIVITHHFATFKEVDKIILINKGNIDAIGSHEALLASNELYRLLCAEGAKE